MKHSPIGCLVSKESIKQLLGIKRDSTAGVSND